MSTQNGDSAIDLVELLTVSHRDQVARELPWFLVTQRWFGSKSRTITSATLANVQTLPGTNAALTTVAVSYVEGARETYQLPLAITSGSAAAALRVSTPNVIVATLNTSQGPTLLHDAVVDEHFRAQLLALTAASPYTVDLLPSRVASAEQSNTSILYDDRYILKLYRRLQPGENPDVEIPRFLTSIAHFDNIPAYLGHLRGADGTTLAFLQAFAPNQGDGWQWMVEELGRFFASVVHLAAPQATIPRASFLATSTITSEPREYAPNSIAAAALLGRRTAELHLALATHTDDPAFCAEAFTPNDLAADATRIHAQIVSALDAMKQHMPQVPAALTDAAASLLSKRKQLLDRAHTLATASPYRFGRRIRIHGDYHLGQVLRTADDFLVVDFEGEPARSLEERRRKQSPLRDVAGMLRSFSYAAFAALDAHKQHTPCSPSLEAWATAWERSASTAFLASYRDVIVANPELIPEPPQAESMLTAFLLEKALYELLYELNNRPTWLGIPLSGVLSLLREAA